MKRGKNYAQIVALEIHEGRRTLHEVEMSMLAFQSWQVLAAIKRELKKLKNQKRL